ncbi:histone-lysine N-methyltransferase SETMAR [Trichonephila clavata]|uniref:Histone-lysine N-methyltransferase SETMAR n=1 Tax=Trichonephila clavata TaxID=2740835 RepID=A0A8X6HDY4_TRICU|nr:histone-lysine N-methyltransferase SETMAR [Trichonephila clavata]
MPRPRRPRTDCTEENVRKVDDMVKANRRITIDCVVEELGIGPERAHKIINDILGYRKVLARWVPRHTNMEQRMAVSLRVCSSGIPMVFSNPGI